MGDDRKQASVLTDSQLRYLEGSNEPARPRKYDRRIRNRIHMGLLDLNLLFRYLEEDELRKVFGPHFAADEVELLQDRDEKIGPARAAVPGAIAFLAWALDLDDAPILPPFDETQPAFQNLTTAIEKAVHKYLHRKKGILAQVDVDIELSDVDRGERWEE